MQKTRTLAKPGNRNKEKVDSRQKAETKAGSCDDVESCGKARNRSKAGNYNIKRASISMKLKQRHEANK